MDTSKHAVRVNGPSLKFATGGERTFAADVLQVLTVEGDKALVLTARPPSSAAPQANLFLLDARDGSLYWDAPHPKGFYERMELTEDRLTLVTDRGWTVELSVPLFKTLNAWPSDAGPRYRVREDRLTFPDGAIVDFGTHVRETVDIGPCITVLTDKGPPNSPAENVCSVDDRGQFVWRVPRLRAANATGPVPYSDIVLHDGALRLLHPSGFVLDLNPLTGACIREFFT